MTPYDAIRGVPNACQALPNVVTGGQPDTSQLEALAWGVEYARRKSGR